MSGKAIFLDRDNTLIEDPGYINDPDQVKLLPGVAEALVQLKQIGYKLIAVSNQSAVARGIVSEKVLGRIHDRLRQLLAEKGACLDKIYYCPYHPDGAVQKYRKESQLRKPNPGMLLQAAKEMDIDLSQSWMLGNAYRDITAGQRAGCKTILIKQPSPSYKEPEPGQTKPDYVAVNMKEAVNILKRYQHLSTQAKLRPASSSAAIQSRQTIEKPSESTQAQEAPPVKNIPNTKIEQLLQHILTLLKGMHRDDMFSEFSVMKLMAGVLQVIVLFCLLIAIWFLMDPESKRTDSVLIALGFAGVLQLMSLTFFTMHGRK